MLIFFTLVEDAPYEPPNKLIVRWTAKECREWLKFHQVPVGTAKLVAELRGKVHWGRIYPEYGSHSGASFRYSQSGVIPE